MSYDLSNIVVNGVPFLETDLDNFQTFEEIGKWFREGMSQITFIDNLRELSDEELFGQEFAEKRMNKWIELYEKEELEERLLPITIDDKVYTPFYTFDILHMDWEGDNIGWIAKDENNDNVVILTTYSNHYIADIQELKEKINEYQKILSETNQALIEYEKVEQ